MTVKLSNIYQVSSNFIWDLKRLLESEAKEPIKGSNKVEPQYFLVILYNNLQ